MRPIRFRGTLLLLVALAIAGLAFLAIAEESEASWSGEPVPPFGWDWMITQDTVYTDETIRIDGYIDVWSDTTLSLNGCTVIITNIWGDGSNGIYVEPGAVLYMNKTTNPTVFKKDTDSYDLFFDNDGEAYLTDAIIQDLWNEGLRTWGPIMYIEGCTINSAERGVQAWGDVHIGNTTIKCFSIGFLVNNLGGFFVGNSLLF